MNVIPVSRHEFEHEGSLYEIYSHASALQEHDGQHVVRLLGPGRLEVAVLANSCGEGMVLIADILKSLGNRLSREAFVKEGAVRLFDR